MKSQLSTMALYDKLPQYGKELLRSLDATHELERLQCNICSQLFNFDDRKPIMYCMNKICSHEHGVCESCFNSITKSVQKPFKCSFCKQICFEEFEYDSSRFQLIEKLSKVTDKLNEIASNAKKLTEKQTEKKLKQIVERAEKDIFNTTLQSQRKTFLLNRLKKRIDNTEKESQRIVKNVQQRQKDLQRRQESLKNIMEDIMNHQKELQNKNQQYKQQLATVQRENEELRRKLAQFEELRGLQTRRVRRNQPHRQPRPNSFYNEDFYFTEFTFNPRRDSSFLQNFNQNKVDHYVQLKKGRQKYFHAVGFRKIIYHSQMFNYSNQQDRLICFQINSLNKAVTRYKFGLADRSFDEIKDANLSIHFQEMDENEPLIIIFYVNLIKMKLYATSKNVRTSQDLPKGFSITKFTVFLYFVDIKTQIQINN